MFPFAGIVLKKSYYTIPFEMNEWCLTIHRKQLDHARYKRQIALHATEKIINVNNMHGNSEMNE